MSSFSNRNVVYLIIPLVLLLIGATLIIMGPSEATIGNGIRIVYLHVAFIWAGMLGLLIDGIMGILVLITNRQNLGNWLLTIGWVSLGVFALGVAASLVAEIVNWGGIVWREPRTAANLKLLAIATIFQIMSSWINNQRWRSLLYGLLALIVVWVTTSTDLQLHPSGAISSSPSAAIQITFYGLTLVVLLFSTWLVLMIEPRLKF